MICVVYVVWVHTCVLLDVLCSVCIMCICVTVWSWFYFQDSIVLEVTLLQHPSHVPSVITVPSSRLLLLCVQVVHIRYVLYVYMSSFHQKNKKVYSFTQIHRFLPLAKGRSTFILIINVLSLYSDWWGILYLYTMTRVHHDQFWKSRLSQQFAKLRCPGFDEFNFYML